MSIRIYELAGELGVDSRDVLECARTLGLDVTSPLADIDQRDADQIRAAVQNPRLSTIRTYELARELGVESRDVLECARILGLDVTSPLGGISVGDADEIRGLLDRGPLPIERGSTLVAERDTIGVSDDVAGAATNRVQLEQQNPRFGEESEEHVDRVFRLEEVDSSRPIPRRERPVQGRRREVRHRRTAPAEPQRIARVVPIAPGHHLPSGRFHVAYLLLLATIFAIPFEETIRIPGLGTLAKALGLAAFAAWFLGVLVSGRMRTPVGFHYLFFAIGAWTSLSLYWSLDTSATAGRIVTFFLLLALVLVIWDLCDTAGAVRAALQAYVLGTWVTAITVYLNFAQNNQVKYGRFGSDAAADPNVTALFLAIGLPIAWYLFLNAKHRSTRWVNLAYVPVGVLAMALSGSRGGFIAGSVALVYVAMSIPRGRPAAFVTALLALVGAVAVVIALVPAESFERIGTVDESIASGDFNGRTEIWQRAWDVYVDHPLIGTGAGSTRKVLGLDKVGHNVGVTAGLELGIIGALLLGAILVIVFRRALWLRRPERRMWVAVLLMWSIGAMTLDLATKKVTWLLFGLLVAAAATELAASRTQRTSTEDPVAALDSVPGRWT